MDPDPEKCMLEYQDRREGSSAGGRGPNKRMDLTLQGHLPEYIQYVVVQLKKLPYILNQ
ncbi:hypothetical protein HKBW3S42_01669, partial [Candidatus Hakubella thermalkaliphila]